jgi:hypothetical protein
LVADSGETQSVADHPENQKLVEDLLGVLANHLKATARDPGSILDSEKTRAFLAHSLPPVEAWHRRS